MRPPIVMVAAVAAMLIACGDRDAAPFPDQTARGSSTEGSPSSLGSFTDACGVWSYMDPRCPEVNREYDPMVQLALRIPGFGGFFLNGSRELAGLRYAPPPSKYTVILKDLSVSQHAANVVVASYPSLGIDPQEIGFVQGEYDMLDLARWECQTFPLLSGLAWTSTDLDEGINRVVIGLATEQARACAQGRLESLRPSGVPIDAIVFEVRPYLRLLSGP
jgi:hypothetical protein